MAVPTRLQDATGPNLAAVCHSRPGVAGARLAVSIVTLIGVNGIQSLRTDTDVEDPDLAEGGTDRGQRGVDFRVGEVIRLSMPVDRHRMAPLFELDRPNRRLQLAEVFAILDGSDIGPKHVGAVAEPSQRCRPGSRSSVP